jgi:hypothetical protein
MHCNKHNAFSFVCDTHADSFPLQLWYRKFKWNYPGMSVSNRETIYSHAKMFGASGCITDSNRNAEGLLTTADNGEHIENSIKFSRADSHVKRWRFAEVSGTDFVSIFRVLLEVWFYEPISKCERTNWWRFLLYKVFGHKYPLCYSAIFTRILQNWSALNSCQCVSLRN